MKEGEGHPDRILGLRAIVLMTVLLWLLIGRACDAIT